MLLRVLAPKCDERYPTTFEVLEGLTMTLNGLFPRYNEMVFANFIQEWMPVAQISINQIQQQLRTNDRSSNITVTRNFTFRLPKGLSS